MRTRTGLLVLAAGLLSAGCLTGFKHPLGPPEEGFIEKPLLGKWSCAVADDAERGNLEFVEFDEHQYYVESPEEGKSELSRYCAHATRIEGEPFLNVREIGPGDHDEWQILAYDATATDRLRLRLVDPDAFKDILDDPAAVRQRLGAELQNPEVVHEYLSCVRVEARK